jgi:hypothetical protein
MADPAAFLAANSALPWAWGSVDCCMALADWIVANGSGDPLDMYRGTYADEAGYLAIVVKRGGLLPVIADGCARVGLSTVADPSIGVAAVIGALIAPTLQRPAIWGGSGWLVRGPDGFAPMDAPALGMWSV